MCLLNVYLLSVTFDPETADIRSVILTHPVGGHYVATIIVSTCLVLYVVEFRSLMLPCG